MCIHPVSISLCVTVEITLSDRLRSQHVSFKTDFTEKDYFTIHTHTHITQFQENNNK